MRIAPLRFEDRDRVCELLKATGSFSSEEIGVALELFDLCHPEGAQRDPCHPERAQRDLCHPERAQRVEGSAPDFARLADEDYELVGAYDDGDTLLGYACFGPTPSTTGTYDLYWLAVHPAAQGRGAGRTLVRWVEHELALRGGRLLVAETSSRADYAQARAFYACAGYVEAARVRDFYAPADDRIILTTRLTTREGGVATR
ncbi:MAG: GNAT family N-acetyltransferase [bacterium]